MWQIATFLRRKKQSEYSYLEIQTMYYVTFQTEENTYKY